MPPLHPLRPWEGAPPFGILIVLVTGTTAKGVAEETHVQGAGDPERLGVGWKYAGRGQNIRVFKRLRAHNVFVMPEVQAEGLIARLRERSRTGQGPAATPGAGTGAWGCREMSAIYQAAPGDRYLARVEDGIEFLVRLGVRPVNPIVLRRESNAPYGLLTVLVTGVTAEGVEEVAEVLGAGHPDRLGVGWIHHSSSGHGSATRIQTFRRLRTHPVRIMPTEAAETLIARLRERQAEKWREWREREAPGLELEMASWARQIERIDEEKAAAQAKKQRMRK